MLNKLSLDMEKKALQKQVKEIKSQQQRQVSYREQLQEQIHNDTLSQHQKKQMEDVNATYGQKKHVKECIIAEKVRQDTIEKLRKENVPETYLSELKRMKISQAIA